MRPLVLLLLLPLTAAADCASTLGELRRITGDPGFPLRWEETSMDDGKPMVVSIFEQRERLVLEFVKTGEGLWAETTAEVCGSGAELRTQVTADRIRLGPAANWILRAALANGGRFTLQRVAADQLRITVPGWSGRFVAAGR